MRVIKITAKCSDCFSAILWENNKPVSNYDGYVPDWMPDDHWGDYVQLEIDIDTGKILNWHKPTAAQLAKTFSNKS